MRKPVTQKRGTRGSHGRPETPRIRAQTRNAGPGKAQVVCVAYQPTFNLIGINFGVELKPEHILAQRERLVGVRARGSQVRRVGRQIKGVAVPVQHRPVQVAKRRGEPFGGERQSGPADLPRLPRKDLSTRRASDELRSQANAERRSVSRQAILDDAAFVLEKWEVRFFIRAKWAAQNDENVRILGLNRTEIVNPAS